MNNDMTRSLRLKIRDLGKTDIKVRGTLAKMI